jgi:hypothetical protein
MPMQDADMSRYHFNLVGEYVVNDRDGMDLPDIEAARRHAIDLARALMARTRIFRAEPARWNMQVTNSEGHEVANVSFVEASMLTAGSQQGKDRAAFNGQLGWKAQLHIGQQMAMVDREIVEQELPERFGDLLRRLAQAPNPIAIDTPSDGSAA